MRRLGLLIVDIILLVILASTTTLASVPETEEQNVYGLVLNDGYSFKSTLACREVDTIYIVSGIDSFFMPTTTDVYYWPITDEYMADWATKNEKIEGTLEVLKNGTVIRRLQRSTYAFKYPEGYSGEQDAVLLKGDRAQKAYEEYLDAMYSYWNATSRFSEEQTAYWDSVEAYLDDPDSNSLPEEPRPPDPPGIFVTKPAEAFIVNLDVGSYRIRMVDVEGEAIPGTEKKLEVITHRREGVGYKVIPEDKWTYPEHCNDPSDVIYLDDKQVLYLTPLKAKEYPELPYSKLEELHVRGDGGYSKNAWIWVHGAPMSGTTMEILRNGQIVESLKEEPFQVVQTPGSALGYEIQRFMPHTEIGEAEGTPAFTAFKLDLNMDSVYVLRLLDADRNVIAGSEREIRPVRTGNAMYLWLIALIPIVVGSLVLAWRSSRSRLKEQLQSG